MLFTATRLVSNECSQQAGPWEEGQTGHHAQTGPWEPLLLRGGGVWVGPQRRGDTYAGGKEQAGPGRWGTNLSTLLGWARGMLGAQGGCQRR